MSLWSARQHEWLEAMGLVVMRLASDASSERTRHSGSEPPAPEAPSASTRASTERLQRAVLHALRSSPEPATSLSALDIDIDALRGNAASKRALWPRLRAMRAASR